MEGKEGEGIRDLPQRLGERRGGIGRKNFKHKAVDINPGGCMDSIVESIHGSIGILTGRLEGKEGEGIRDLPQRLGERRGGMERKNFKCKGVDINLEGLYRNKCRIDPRINLDF